MLLVQTALSYIVRSGASCITVTRWLKPQNSKIIVSPGSNLPSAPSFLLGQNCLLVGQKSPVMTGA